MTSAKKKGGLGAESYFENIPTLAPVEEKKLPVEAEVANMPAEEATVVGPAEIAAEEELPAAKQEILETNLEAEDADDGSQASSRQKIRRTYALYEETQIALEEMKLAARKQGVKMTLGDLLEEAVQLLMEKKGMVSREARSA